MSTAATEEDLRFLSDVVPLLAKKVADAQQSAQALESALTEFQQEADEARQDVATRLTDMKDALPSLTAQVEGEEKALNDADTALVGAWHEGQPRLAAAAEAALAPFADVISHTQDLQAALAEAGTRIDQSQAMGEAALGKLTQDCKAAEERIKAAIEGLEKEIEEKLAEAADELIHVAITNAATSLEMALGMANGRCDAALEGARDEMDNKRIAFKGASPALYESLGGRLVEKVDALDGEIQHAVTTPLTEAETELEHDVEKLGVTTEVWGQELEQHTQKLGQAIEEVKQEAASVPAGVAEINNAAVKLGF